jgi:hypothetical protein
MQSIVEPADSKLMVGAGYVLSALVALFLLADGVMKVLELPVVLETNAGLGYAESTARGLGILLLICTALYAIPRTAVLGAILLTAYLGGAVATHVRVGSPLAGYTLFGVYVGLLLWAGLFLRDRRVRDLLPWRR